jgi:predicted patatin/cPLA2 family phospholipase
MFSISPVKKNGDVRLTRALFKHGSFGEQKIDKLLGSLITEELYYQYQNGNYPTCLVQTVNRKTKEIKVWNLKSTKLDYTDYLNIVAASAAIPIYTQGIWINGEEHYDGGLKDTIVNTNYIFKYYNPSEIISVYSLPIDRYNRVKKVKDRWIKLFNLPSLIQDVLEIKLEETRTNDVMLEKYMCYNRNVKLTQYFLPDILHSFYDTDRDRLRELYNETLKLFNKK